MRRVYTIIVVLAILFAQDSPRLYVVPSVDTVYPGQLFSVTVTAFGEVGPVQFDAGDFQVVTDTVALPTRNLWLRAAGPPRDVRVRAWTAGVEASRVVRICCVAAPDAVGTRRVFLPVLRR